MANGQMKRRSPGKTDYEKLNPHINFKREKDKSSARKDLTKVTCINCKARVELPFKPRRPEVYCDKCYKAKREHGNKGLKQIHLDRIAPKPKKNKDTYVMPTHVKNKRGEE